MSKNIKTEVVKDKLVITIDLKGKRWPSASGKTSLIASSEGNMAVDNSVVEDLKLGLNLYVPNKRGETGEPAA